MECKTCGNAIEPRPGHGRRAERCAQCRRAVQRAYQRRRYATEPTYRAMRLRSNRASRARRKLETAR